MTKKFLKYSAVGVVGTSVDFLTLFIQVEFLHINLYFALVISFLFAATTNHLLNRHYTFQTTHNAIHHEYFKFLSVSTFGIITNMFVVFILNEKFGLYYIFAKIIATGIVLVWNFLLNYHWTFRIKN